MISEIALRLRQDHKKTALAENRDPFLVLISTIISQRTRDQNTRVASKKLFSLAKRPDEIVKLDIEKIEEAIRPSGFYKVKSRVIFDVCQALLERFDGKVPDTMEELLTLKGVGRKTANCVLVYGFKKNAIPVDIHVHRISNRIGWVDTKTPEETEKCLEKVLPEKYWIEINELLVKHGQNTCLPRNPKCEECSIEDLCGKRIFRH